MRTRLVKLPGGIKRDMPQSVIGTLDDALNNRSHPVKGSRVLEPGTASEKDIDDRQGRHRSK